AWAGGAMADAERLEAGARRVAMTIGRSLELAYLCAHAQWCLDHGRGRYAAAAARRFARNGVDLVDDVERDDTRALLA
ncbi:MAG: acyl-CoA dehydrogenase, partial [Deltaproteobacteria bacterium]|nr:acyl-CoA dehydrogenase [Kofleriaceae bacterium]